MKVRIHDKPTQVSGRKNYPETSQIVSVNLVKENKKTVLVRLPDNNIIIRDKSQIVEI